MGYRVEYGPVKKVRGLEKRFSQRAALTALFLLVFFVLVGSLWPEGTDVLKKVLFSGDPAVTAAALEDLTVDLRAGETVAESLRSFCLQILEGAGFASGQ